MSSITFRMLRSRASTPPAEERVTLFFARAKKKVTRKESTLRGAPGFTHGRAGKLHRWQLRVRRCGITASPLASPYRRGYLTAAHFLAPIKWTGSLRANPDLQSSSSEAQNNVLSFGDFSLHGQRKVTRSAAGRVEALLIGETKALDYMRLLSHALRAVRYANVRFGILPPQSRLCGNDEQELKTKREPTSCVG